jgi:L-2-hydroxyglutarate oxidase LhgO
VADVALTVIGGGVVGLAIADACATRHAPLVLCERNPRYGHETSSRNSEVIHAGIYYPPGSLKARLCVEGRELLYSLSRRHGIPFRNTGKIITATDEREAGVLEQIHRQGTENGAPLELLTAAQVKSLEPHIVTCGGILSPSTGIISAHALMDHFAAGARAQGATIQTRCTVVGVARDGNHYAVSVEEGGTISTFSSERVVNAAGLEADTIAALAGIDVDAAGYRLHYSKGSYFSVPAVYGRLVSRLVYPVPGTESLGVHVVLDLAGRMRFGPDVEPLLTREVDLRVDETKRSAFGPAVRKILPGIRDEDLTPDICGIRPRLRREGDAFRDFVIREESDRGLPGFIDLIGIESPGLTASAAIAREVFSLL